MNEQANNYLKMKTFLTIFGIIITVLIVVFSFVFTEISAMDAKYDNCQKIFSDVNAQLSGIEVNINWIKDKLEQ